MLSGFKLLSEIGPSSRPLRQCRVHVVVMVSRCRSYLVTVKKLDARRRRQAPVRADGEEFHSYHESPDAYVAAEIDKDDRADVFVIGDNKTYGNYTNPPLQEGTKYEIRTGSASKTDKVSVYH